MTDQVWKFFCTPCDYGTNKEDNWVEHHADAHPPPIRPPQPNMKCPSCGITSVNMGEWMRHIEKCPPRRIIDPVNHPLHYTAGKVECIDAIEAAVTGLEGSEAVCTGQVIKYVWRWKKKGGVEDLRKAQWYLERLIRSLTQVNKP